MYLTPLVFPMVSERPWMDTYTVYIFCDIVKYTLWECTLFCTVLFVFTLSTKHLSEFLTDGMKALHLKVQFFSPVGKTTSGGHVLCEHASSLEQTPPSSETDAENKPHFIQSSSKLGGRTGKQTYIKVGKIITLVFIYRAITGFMDYLPRANCVTVLKILKNLITFFCFSFSWRSAACLFNRSHYCTNN